MRSYLAMIGLAIPTIAAGSNVEEADEHLTWCVSEDRITYKRGDEEISLGRNRR